MDNSDVYGPALPPGFKKEEIAATLPEEKEQTSENNSTKLIGPQCPSHLLKQKKVEELTEESDCSDSQKNEDSMTDQDSGTVGPILPPGFSQPPYAGDESDSNSNEVYGPLPTSDNNVDSVDVVLADIEKRALKMKDKLKEIENPSIKKAEREEWMTSPATGYKNQFGDISRCLAGESSDSKSNQSSSQKRKQEKKYSKSEEKLKEQMKEYNEVKRPESLLEMHRKEKKRKDKEDSSKPKKRKPFDRDAELGIRFFNKQQVDSVIKKAKFVNSRFQAGSSHYL